MFSRLLLYIGIGIYLFHIGSKNIKGTIPVQIIDVTLPIQTNNVTSNNIILEDVMPISDYRKPYEVEEVNDIWIIKDISSYIDSEHEVVQWFVRNTEMNNEILYYKNTDIRVVPKYYSDSEYVNNDYWQNADYYLSHGLVGDCEDYVIAIAYILEAKGIPNMLTLGFAGTINNGHALLEYYINGKYYTTDIYYGLYIPRENVKKMGWMPKRMFNKNTNYITYNENWNG